MKIKFSIIGVFLACVVMMPAFCPAEEKADVKSEETLPYFFPETTYTFQPVVEGTEVVHEYKVINKGTDLLSILNVKTA